jgi:hypothetical protein
MASFSGTPVVGPLTTEIFSPVREMILGSEIMDVNGNAYRYSFFAQAPQAGRFYQAPTPVAAHSSLVIASAAAIGDRQIRITNGATPIVAEQYIGGIVTVQSGAGLGQSFVIVNHNAAAAAGVITLTLDETVGIAIPAASTLALQANRYNGAVVATTTPVEVVGVACNSSTLTNVYGWLCVSGQAPVVAGAAITAGQALRPSTTVAGSVEIASAVSQQILGCSISAIAANAAGLAQIKVL